MFSQLYRGFGWPHAFRKDEALQAVDELMEKLKGKRYDWGVGNSCYENGLYYHRDSSTGDNP